MTSSSPARLFAGPFGAVLVVAGIIGFFYESTLTDDKAPRSMVPVNTEDNVLHLVIGLAGVATGAADSGQMAPGSRPLARP